MSALPFALAIALVSTAPTAVASARADDVVVKLSVRGVDFTDSRQVKVFYDHARVAAHAACYSDSLTPRGLREDRECEARLVDGAVNQVNAPLLTEMNTLESPNTSTRAFFGNQ
jgi:UrcA family protein